CGSGAHSPAGKCAPTWLVPNLARDVVLFVDLAVRALADDVVLPPGQAQHASRHDPGLDEHLRVFDRHVVMELVTVATQLFDDAQGARVSEAAAPEPPRVVEVDGLDDGRVAFPVPDALPVVRREIELLRGQLTSVDRDVAELVVAAAV